MNPGHGLAAALFCLALLHTVPIPAATCNVDPRAVDVVELAARTFYDRLEALDYPAVRALTTPQLEILSMTTPEFEILGEGVRIGHTQFERQIIAARQAGTKLRFKLTQHRTSLAGGIAYTSYMLHVDPHNRSGVGEMVFICGGGRWLLDRLTHMPFYPGYPD